MGVIAKEALDLYRKVRDQYPQTFEWAKHKARWEQMPIVAVFDQYEDHIFDLMKQEKDGDGNGNL